VIGRLAGHATKTKVIYTAHGFHFFKGAPLKNWLIYYPIERFCARLTDVLITINKEDYALAQKKMPAKKVCYVPGVGIDLEKIRSVQVDRNEVRKSMGVPEDCILLASVGELSVRKNHQIVIKAVAKLKNSKVHYAIAGQGVLLHFLKNLSKELGVEQQVHFLGYRKDIAQIYKSSDVAILPSLQEGLPVALMEAMASGLPIICSKIRGNTDLVQNIDAQFVCNEVEDLYKKINNLITSKTLQEQLAQENKKNIDFFSLNNVLEKIKNIYNSNI
jgi:glycosyltransferase involved in cell wall biosynthesis